ncbi:hypothetical protein BOTBODRAFT_170823 [Botryobasidium botryosum FD-172 SS1]|uniref:DNA replication regulator Sld3 C-terminal domain-containing protein n=1 Tax=Botryobasidium botryosum (strain FD-172 SS1) TaxID=930990 RepID=A0A067MSZ1_BOTB1|nr:hypothetical protein BOTBODRAFT_170823 [Botryobasidium botryosum FD-172 SS1]
MATATTTTTATTEEVDAEGSGLFIKAHPYSLDLHCPIPWPTPTTEIHPDYPLKSAEDETADDFVIRKYLETLWLAEALMPLAHLVPSLQRVEASTSSRNQQKLHPLSACIHPLLLTLEQIENKFRAELPQILTDGGGEDEIEEKMMWFAWGSEKLGDMEPGEALEKSKKKWLDRLERREVQIQVLLHFMVLSLASSGATEQDKKRKRSRKKEKKRDGPSTEETLERLTDRLCIWQTLASLDSVLGDGVGQAQKADEKDWVQTFCDDVVAPSFVYAVPSPFQSFRAQIFPVISRATSPSSPLSPPRRAVKAPKDKDASGATLARTRSRRSPSPTHPLSTGSLRRSMSRSMSVVSLIEGEESQSVRRGGVVSSSRLFKGREVGMKRTATAPKDKDVKGKALEDRPKGSTSGQTRRLPSAPLPRTSSTIARSQSSQPMLLVASTPVKPKHSKQASRRSLSLSFPEGEEELDWDAISLEPDSPAPLDFDLDSSGDGRSLSRILVPDTPQKGR